MTRGAARLRAAGRAALPWVALVAASAAVRLGSFRTVFSNGGVWFLYDSDTYYHVLRAHRIVRDFPHVAPSDAFMNFPVGARIPWPPLFDLAIALPARLLGGTPADVELVAAVVPVLFGVAAVVATTGLALYTIGRRSGWLAGALMCALPISVEYTVLGRPDQHSAELLYSACVFGIFVAGMVAGARRLAVVPAALLGAALAISFWNWQGSGLYLALLAAFTGIVHVLARPHARAASTTLAAGAGMSALLLAASLAAFAPGDLTSFAGDGATGLAVALSLAVCLAAAILASAARWRARTTRLLATCEVLVAAAVPAAALLLVPAIREGAGVQAAALLRSNPWYQIIGEFQPLVLGHRAALAADVRYVLAHYGATMLLIPVGAFFLLRSLRREWNPKVAFVLIWGLLFFAATLIRRRFGLYLAAPLALLAAVGIDGVAAAAGSRLGLAPPGTPAPRSFRWIAAALAVAPSVLAAGWTMPIAVGLVETAPALELVKSSPVVPGREAVLADWPLGHLVQYFSGRPVLATPFGTDGGDGAMEDLSAFLLAPDEAAMEAILARRRAGFVLLDNPANGQYMATGFATGPERSLIQLVPDRLHGPHYRIQGAYRRLPVTRLYFADGAAPADGSAGAISGLRLLYESPDPDQVGAAAARYRLYGVVPGASVAVAGAPPGDEVRGELAVRTNLGRTFRWAAVARADAAGRAVLRVPYSTGQNGFVAAGPLTIRAGTRSAVVGVAERQVLAGEIAQASLAE